MAHNFTDKEVDDIVGKALEKRTAVQSSAFSGGLYNLGGLTRSFFGEKEIIGILEIDENREERCYVILGDDGRKRYMYADELEKVV